MKHAWILSLAIVLGQTPWLAAQSYERDYDSTRRSSSQQDWADWWSSWWEDNEGGDMEDLREQGVQRFIRQHDNNNDGHLTLREATGDVQNNFRRFDTNDDGYLSPQELRRQVTMRRDTSRSTSTTRSTPRSSTARSSQNQSWANWWSNWWDDNEGGDMEDLREQGVQRFIRQHDNNSDGYLTQREATGDLRDNFNRFDTNDDGYLTSSELRQQVSMRRSTAGRQQNQRGEIEDVRRQGVQQFIRQHDNDNDGYLSQREATGEIQQKFRQFDTNDDGYLGSQELQRQVQSTASRSSRNQDYQRSSYDQGYDEYDQYRQSQNQRSSSSRSQSQRAQPVEVTYIWITDVNAGRAELSDLQESYELLREIDQDNDGEISRSELRERRQQAMGRMVDRQFRQLDQNDDDSLSRQEVQNTFLAESFDELDRNSDGSVTRSEVRQASQQSSDSSSSENGSSSQRSSSSDYEYEND
jgi:Ca2+-binding EF-hand superfamily protein